MVYSWASNTSCIKYGPDLPYHPTNACGSRHIQPTQQISYIMYGKPTIERRRCPGPLKFDVFFLELPRVSSAAFTKTSFKNWTFLSVRSQNSKSDTYIGERLLGEQLRLLNQATDWLPPNNKKNVTYDMIVMTVTGN